MKNSLLPQILTLIAAFSSVGSVISLSAQESEKSLSLEKSKNVESSENRSGSEAEAVKTGEKIQRGDQPPNQAGDSNLQPSRTKVSQATLQLKSQLESNLKYYFAQKENSEYRSPWGVMHAMVAFGPYAEMYGKGRIVKDVDWLCNNEKCRGMQLLTTRRGELETNNGPGRQGHDGQFLAILAQSQVPKTRKLTVGRRSFSIEDLINYEMQTCKPNTELTFKLIGLSHYLDSDREWKSSDGQRWSLERILSEELKQPINGAACGGTHRLMGFSYALLMRKLQEKTLDGHWKKADDFLADFRNHAFKLQNRDGSFSTEWFKRRSFEKDPQRRVQTTGHILEWLLFSATQEQLQDRRLINSVKYLSNIMWSQRKAKWEIGPKGHALRALRLFYERVLADAPQLAELMSWDDSSASIR
ncbi:hypothetical protein OAF71_01125 [bacterium]|nr:hypothetical protein [bacterium]